MGYNQFFEELEKLKQLSENDIENEVIKLTGKYLPNSNSKIPEISLNSPLGRTIYGKKVNSKCEYKVNSNMISATIIRKIIV